MSEAQVNATKFDWPEEKKIENLEQARQDVKERLACAYRVFGKLGFDEGVAGHLTVRDPIKRDCFWVCPWGKSFSYMCASDLLMLNEEGNIVGGGKPENQKYNRAAFVIHAAIHAARPEIDAACHSHSTFGKAFSSLGIELDMITQDSCSFYNDHALYPEFGGVVLADEESANIVKYLGKRKALILQNHGILTVGHTIEEAVSWFIRLEKCCQVQLAADAAALGRGKPTTKIAPEVAEFTHSQNGKSQAGHFMATPYFERVLREDGEEYKN